MSEQFIIFCEEGRESEGEGYPWFDIGFRFDSVMVKVLRKFWVMVLKD